MMESKEVVPNQPQAGSIKKARRFKKIRWIFLILVVLVILCSVGVYGYNNFSTISDEEFARQVDISLGKALGWLEEHRAEVISKKNVALIRMLQDADSLHHDPLLVGIVEEFIATPARPDCWKRLVDPDHPVSYFEINRTIEREIIDNKWILYALAPEKAKLTEKQMTEFYDGDLWQGRQLTHQLWALIHLRERRGTDDKLEELIEHICKRITGQLAFNIPVVDIYIQKNAFVLMAGHPQKIERRWIERIIENQEDDGGWNDRWYCFRSPIKGRRPIFSPQPPSNQHATLQALWLLYQVKYRYPEYFCMK